MCSGIVDTQMWCCIAGSGWEDGEEEEEEERK